MKAQLKLTLLYTALAHCGLEAYKNTKRNGEPFMVIKFNQRFFADHIKGGIPDEVMSSALVAMCDVLLKHDIHWSPSRPVTDEMLRAGLIRVLQGIMDGAAKEYAAVTERVATPEDRSNQ